MDRSADQKAEISEAWRAFFMGEFAPFHRTQRVFRLLPSSPRCKVCFAPFKGAGGQIMRVMGRGPAKMNPSICDVCERFASVALTSTSRVGRVPMRRVRRTRDCRVASLTTGGGRTQEASGRPSYG